MLKIVIVASMVLVAFGISTSAESRERGHKKIYKTNYSQTTSRECLDPATRGVLNSLEARFGKVKIVKSCVPGARMPSGHVSWHARNKAFDFKVPKGVDQRDVMVWLTKNSPGVTISYRGSLAGIIHTDTGSFHKVIYAAADHEAGHRAVAIWQERERLAALPPAAIMPAPVLPPKPAAEPAPIVVASLGELDGWTAQYDVEPPQHPVVAVLVSIMDYLLRTATVGGTMARQGPEVALSRLHPEFRRRLAPAIRQARAEGMPRAGCFSPYRPPGFKVGGYRDKFQSNHAYGLACDIAGIGRPGSATAKRWHNIATAHGLYNPYYGKVAREWNHYQVTPTVMAVRAVPALRKTITAKGPIDVERMWRVADVLIDRKIGGDVRATKWYAKKRYAYKYRKPSRYAAAG